MIPPILHFVFGLAPDFGGKPFTFFHYLAVLSAVESNPGWKALFHCQYEPPGPYFECVRDLVEVVPVEAPREVFGRPLRHVAHQADVLRLRLLCEVGGAYLDVDTVTARGFEDLRDRQVVLGTETFRGYTVGLCNAIMLASPGAEFMRLWLDAYRTFRSRGRDRYWNEHSVKVPHELARRWPGLLTLLGDEAFNEPDYSGRGFRRMHGRAEDFPRAYAHHLVESAFWRDLARLNERNVFRIESTYCRLARRFLGPAQLQRLGEARRRHLARLLEAPSLKLHLGDGAVRPVDHVSVDGAPDSAPDLVCDLARERWPFEDGTVGEVRLHHFLERLGDRAPHALAELRRVCRDGARVHVLAAPAGPPRLSAKAPLEGFTTERFDVHVPSWRTRGRRILWLLGLMPWVPGRKLLDAVPEVRAVLRYRSPRSGREKA